MREFDLLRQVFQANADLPSHVTLPPGDDMGAVRLLAGAGQDPQVLVTVDQVADGVHFDLRAAAIDQAGRKAITRNLSDVAAMGAWPLGAVAAACLPRHMPDPEVLRLVQAMQRTARSYACPIFGGDVSVWDQRLIITVTVLAQMRGPAPVQRRGAAPGDVVFVSGDLGGSMESVAGRTHHLDFEPRLALGQLLAGDPVLRPTAMIDLSDGLGRDLGHIAECSQVAAVVEAAALPVGPACRQAAARSDRPVWHHALADGEDYELCFTVPEARARQMPRELAGLKITRIGAVVAATADAPAGAVRLRLPDGALRDAADLGWEHHSR